jgi:hypothetical protein
MEVKHMGHKKTGGVSPKLPPKTANSGSQRGYVPPKSPAKPPTKPSGGKK